MNVFSFLDASNSKVLPPAVQIEFEDRKS